MHFTGLAGTKFSEKPKTLKSLNPKFMHVGEEGKVLVP